jgi:putative acetyltransferase
MTEPASRPPATAIRIRDFRSGDEALLRQVFVSAINGSTGGHYSQAQREAWLAGAGDVARWNLRIQRLQPFVALHDGVVAGYADLQPSGLIDHFFVATDHAHRGVGSALLQHLQQQARRRGIVELHAHVSLSAERFFKRHGFRVKQRQTVRVAGIGLDNAVMCKHMESEAGASAD